MQIFEWIVWGAGCVALLIGLMLSSQGKIMGTPAKLFSLCMIVGLAVTYFVAISKLHLLWYGPVALLASGYLGLRLGARMMGNGLEQAAADPRFKEAFADVVRKGMEERNGPSDDNRDSAGDDEANPTVARDQ